MRGGFASFSEPLTHTGSTNISESPRTAHEWLTGSVLQGIPSIVPPRQP